MDNFTRYYNKLNPNQKKAVDIIDGPLLILAGSGTGKTELLSVRAANIIRQKKARPENILILTYKNLDFKNCLRRMMISENAAAAITKISAGGRGVFRF